ncbi:hypothetical protein FVR03_02730 [Pontibacter qinzhouensis]|uniref:Uncharacterized protein n=1 Tax=Pontibacter qinzhouensis TaxID=2603253 RepID=A0A5C8KEK5_9BACT|nr:hypothetical protein [Pontibacter qinzhouensis]TXK51866.1 hypothetical protein FVR03_02730 [Pontibacter qinzhouensis]
MRKSAPAISPELKQAISSLSHSEKDKLLYRLLKLNPDLVERLQFELVEQGDSLMQRREELTSRINDMLAYEPYSPGYLMMDLRSLNGEITRHVKHTKDKEGEIQLTLYMLRQCLELHGAFIVTHLYRADTLQNYLIKRMEAVLQKLRKMHEDLYVEYEADVTYILKQLHEKIAPKLAKKSLPEHWPE